MKMNIIFFDGSRWNEALRCLPVLLKRKAIVVGTVTILVMPGCQTANVCDDQISGNLFCSKNCEDIPAGAIPQPLGKYVCAWHGAHTAAANRDDRVLYSYQFECGGDQLSADGKRHLRMQMGDTGDIVQPIIVQAVEDAELSVRRRNSVVNYLAEMGIEQPDDLVMIGESKAEGILGQEASRVTRGITSQSNSSGGRGSGQSRLGGGGVF